MMLRFSDHRGLWVSPLLVAGCALLVLVGVRAGAPSAPAAARRGAPLVTASPTLPACAAPGVIANGDFETGSLAPWIVDGPNPAPVVVPNPHSGSYALQVGTLSGPEPLGNSAVYQQITVPPAGGILSF